MEIRKYIYLFFAIICFTSTYISAKNTIMIVHPDGDAFTDVIKGMSVEFDTSMYAIKSYQLKDLSVDDFKENFKKDKPSMLVLMDNKSVSLYKKAEITENIPVLGMMGVNIKSAMADIKNSGAISYEIPIVTSLVNLRSAMNKPITNVGVITRSNLKEFISENKPFCENEKINLIHINIASNDDEKIRMYIEKGLDILINKKHVDAVWIPNDIKLLNPTLITKYWAPILSENKIPVVVGIEKLLSTKLNFGTFAVLPDHYALGSQAAQVINDVFDNDGVFEENFNEPPIGVYTIVNKDLATKINENINLNNVDKIIK